MNEETNVPDFTLDKPVVTVSVSPFELTTKVIASLNSFSESDVFGDIVWKESGTPRASVLHVVLDDVGEMPVSHQISAFIIKASSPANVPFAVAAASAKHKLALPTGRGVENFMARILKFNESWQKLKCCKQQSLLDYEKPVFIRDGKPGIPSPDDIINAKIFALFPRDLETHLPEAKKILDSRFKRVLQRKKPGYHPLETREDISTSCYAHAIHDSDEHVKLRMAIRDDVEEETGVKLSPSNLQYAQQGIGVPVLGGHNRKVQGFTEPTSRFKRLAKRVCAIHLRGLVEEYIKVGPEAFGDITVRAGLKPHSFQGAPSLSYNFLDHLMLLRVMSQHERGLFMFDDDEYEFPTIVGFRSQDPGGKWINGKFVPKCRVSYMVAGACEVMRTTVLDAELLSFVNKFAPPDIKLPKGYAVYASVADLYVAVTGARIRHVTNPPVPLNDATVVVPALIRKFKTKEYKQIMGQADEVMDVIVPASAAFEEFWTLGFNESKLVRDAALNNHGISSATELVKAMRREGNRIYAGDVQNFDGNVNINMINDGMGPLLSDGLMSISTRIFNAPILGTTSTPSSTQLYYIVDRTDEETANLASHLPSGWGCTSQAGRIIVPITLNEMLLNAFEKDGLTEDILFDMAKPDSIFSIQAAFYNCAGDDHVVNMIAAWLFTGKSVDDCHALYSDAVESYTTLKMEPENPPMCAGFLFHLGEGERVESVSLSPNRLSVNTLSPEYPRTAIGLEASTSQYVASAKGTPVEYEMEFLRDKIVHDVYNLTDEELEDGVEEDLIFIEENITNGADPREVIAQQLGVSPSRIDYDYSPEELLQAGVDEELLESYTLPIPPELTKDPARFVNMETIVDLATAYPWSLEVDEPSTLDESSFDSSAFLIDVSHI